LPIISRKLSIPRSDAFLSGDGIFREEIAQMVASPAEVDEELQHLCAVMAG
jgi:hypothetical protein